MMVVAVSELGKKDSVDRMANVALNAIDKLEKENADIRGKLAASELTISVLRAKLFESEDKRDDLSAKIGQLESQAVHIYNSGYHAGHNDTVEGCYTDIVSADMDTYHADVVRELREDLLAEVQS